MERDSDERARRAAARAAVDQIEAGTTIGLGSGRAVFCVIEEIIRRWPERPPIRAVCASDETQRRADAAGIERVDLDGRLHPSVAIDGADEVDDRLGLIKGAGAALLREKLVAGASDRFVVVAETPKHVERLGTLHRLPVEVVRFAWPDTRARLLALVADATLRERDGAPVVTDEGHYLLDCSIPPDADLEKLARDVKASIGVVDHGLFLGMADVALLGTPDGEVETLTRG